MANWNNNDGFKNQKKRSFIYKSAGQSRSSALNNVRVEQNLTDQHVNPCISISSPRKKIKTSYNFYDKVRNDQGAAEELCSDLSVDVFEDELGDDLTVEQLCEAASVAEQEIADKERNNSINENKTNRLIADPPGIDVGENFFDDFKLNHLENNGNLNYETHVETAHETTAELFASTGECANPFRNTCTVVDRQTAFIGDGALRTTNGCVNGKDCSMEDFQMIKFKLQKSEEKVKQLEEENFAKAGEVKIIKEAIDNLQTQEYKLKERIRSLEEENKAIYEQKHKELRNKIEHLETQLYFKDQEISQTKEQVKRQMHSSIDSAAESPHKRKCSKLTDNFFIPMGQSFFEKNTSETQSLINKTKNVKLQESPMKIKPDIVNRVCGVTSGNLSSESTKKEKRSLKIRKEMSNVGENELLQKLLQLENIESLSLEYKASPVNHNLLYLLNSSSKLSHLEQSTPYIGLEVQNLKPLDKQNMNTTKKDFVLDHNTKPKDNGLLQSVYSSIFELLNTYKTNTTEKQSCLDLVSNSKISNFFCHQESSASVQGFLPLLEYHISLYVDLRIENDKNSLSCSQSSTEELSEIRQSLDGCVVLSEALDAAVQSLRCLNLLVMHNAQVCDVLLSSSKVLSNNENEAEQLIQISTGAQTNNCSKEKSDLLNLLFKLVIPLHNEPAVVTQAALQVLSSLAGQCPQEYRDRFLPLLCGTILPQCLSRDSSFTILSLVVPILIVTASNPSLMKYLCSQSDECLLLKVYQGCLSDTNDLAHPSILEVMTLIKTILFSKNEVIDSECQCTIKFIKYLVLLLHKEMVFIRQFPPDTVKCIKDASESLLFLRRGVFLLGNLLTNSSRLLDDLQMEKYTNLIIGTADLYSAIKGIPEGEGMILQDLLDIEHIEDVEVQQDYDENTTENMDVDAQ